MVVRCKLNLFADAFVTIWVSKAVNNWDRNFTKVSMRRQLQQIDESSERYLGVYRQCESSGYHQRLQLAKR